MSALIHLENTVIKTAVENYWSLVSVNFTDDETSPKTVPKIGRHIYPMCGEPQHFPNDTLFIIPEL